MTPEQKKLKRIWFVLIILYFLGGYFLCGHINMDRAHYYNVALPFENSIPFMPFFITGYTSVYLALILVYAVIDDFDVFKLAMKFFFALSTIHFIFFLAIPVRMMRPEIAATDGIFTRLTYYYYLIDNPVNCFPSLHVAYPMTGALVLWNYKRGWSYLLLAFTVFIAFSVVLVKQHYIMDVIGGIVTPLIILWFLKRCSKLKNERAVLK